MIEIRVGDKIRFWSNDEGVFLDLDVDSVSIEEHAKEIDIELIGKPKIPKIESSGIFDIKFTGKGQINIAK